MRSGGLKRSYFRRKPNPVQRHMDDLAREIVFHRDGYQCWACAKPVTSIRFRKEDGWPWYPDHHWSHVFGRGRGAMKYVLENATCACMICHTRWHDERFSAIEKENFRVTFPERWRRMSELAQMTDRGRGFFLVDGETVRRGSKGEAICELEHGFNAIRRETMWHQTNGGIYAPA
jgi:hypothetical protein